MDAMAAPSAPIRLRAARRDDVPAIVRLLADDALGSGRETASDPPPDAYYAAFDDITAAPNSRLVVAVLGDDDVVVGTAQVTYVRQMSRHGSLFAELHGVRVASAERGRGYGAAMVGQLIDEARARGCVMVSLGSHASRVDAHRFYARLGFAASHVGMKMALR